MISLKQKIKSKHASVDESHIISSTNLKDEFRYIMEDVNESLSESNITVTGIIDLARSPPHTCNKKSLQFTIRQIFTKKTTLQK